MFRRPQSRPDRQAEDAGQICTLAVRRVRLQLSYYNCGGAMTRPSPPPPCRIWIGGVLYDATVHLGPEGPAPPTAVLVRPLVWLALTPTPNLDAEAPGMARRRAVPVDRADERPALQRWGREESGRR
jgi:hypothetical protein